MKRLNDFCSSCKICSKKLAFFVPVMSNERILIATCEVLVLFRCHTLRTHTCKVCTNQKRSYAIDIFGVSQQ